MVGHAHLPLRFVVILGIKVKIIRRKQRYGRRERSRRAGWIGRVLEVGAVGWA
jgi:hypothetical protein